MKTLILTPNKNEMCGMYQLAKDLAEEFGGETATRDDFEFPNRAKFSYYNKVITLLYPMHKYGKIAQDGGAKWICYDQGIPPVTKQYFPNFWRRQAMRYINWRNNTTMEGADNYWDVTQREQKPRWSKKIKFKDLMINKDYLGEEENILHDAIFEKPYAIYLGRTTDYKNYEWLKKIMNELNINLIHPIDIKDEYVHFLLSNAKLLVTASLWEGYGRPVHEAENLGIPAVSYDTGAQKRNTKKGICVPLGDEEAFKQAVKEIYYK